MTKFIYLIIDIESFEQKCVILRGLLQSYQPKQYMVTIGIDQSLSNSTMYSHRCMENIKKLYTSAGKCDNQQQYKDNLEAAVLSTHDRFTENSPV